MRTSFAAALGLAAVALAGCNMVMTEKPMFTVADRGAAPSIKPGVWRDEKPDCKFDETEAQDKWPECAGASPSVAIRPFWQEVGGDPDILQTPLEIPGAGKDASTYYIYVAYRPLKLDEQGSVIAMKKWPVRCGPPPTPEEMLNDSRERARRREKTAQADQPAGRFQLVNYDAGPNDDADAARMQADMAKMAADAKTLQAQMAKLSPTKAPLPGLTMNETGGCTPSSIAALRAAARASEAWADDDSVSHWVRYPKPGDKPPASAKTLGDTMGGSMAMNTPGDAGASTTEATPPVETPPPPEAAPKPPAPAMPTSSPAGAPVLGVTLAPPPMDIDAVIVGAVTPGSVAARGGVRAGDIIRWVDGEPILTPGELMAAIHRLRSGAVVELVVTRNAAEKTLRLRF